MRKMSIGFFGISAYVIKAAIFFCSKSQEAAFIVYFVRIFSVFDSYNPVRKRTAPAL